MKSPKLVLSDRQIMARKTQLRAMERKRDKIAIEIAKILNFPSIWTINMIDWTVPEVASFKEEFCNLECQITELDWEIAEAEAVKRGDYDYFMAERKVYNKLSKIPIEDEKTLLKSLGLTKSGLIAKVADNPNFLDEVIV